ncbi:MAG TPA: EAL domain-containing protein [Steroidobacteraceae bacterium]|nr:EAL domain-containing protein [Steroidobacteraceae bacterium]
METLKPLRPRRLLGRLVVGILLGAAGAALFEAFTERSGTVLLGSRTLLAMLGLASALAGGAIAVLLASRERHPIRALVGSLDQLGEGDYTQPVSPAAASEFTELAAAIERMREKLHQTTITRNYLDVVLNSMTDAVLVTEPDGRISRANEAAVRLFGWPESELAGRDVASLMAPEERRNFALERAVKETREFMIRTREGGAVPVSLSGSTISGRRAASDAEDGDGATTSFEGCIFVARDITERKRAERRIRYLARYDTLTKIPNRMQFQHLLQQAIARAHRNGTTLALLYLDLDRFKDVNDTFGHAAGDRTLEILSERLTRVVPKGAVVGRLAGDEFAVFIENLPAGDCRPALAAVARQVLDDVSRAFFLNDTEVYLTLSLGVALCPDDAGNTIDLIRNADAAMYHSKQNGGGSYAFYAPEMNAEAVERLILKSKLRRSLERDEFVILYQPKVEIASGRIAGAEALLRWRLPGHGDIPPAHFIPLAEQTNLILPIGEWVLRRVCADYKSWRGQVPDPGRVSINLSLKQLQQASFITRFASVFREYGVEPRCLELEITETTLMSNAPRTVRMLGELHDLGINLSIDDFGTGYSSLSALQQLPVETLKIDQSFVRKATVDAQDATLVRTIIEMGRNLEMQVVAEGVETIDQLEFLRALGCHYAQGRLFGEPMSAEALLALLAAQQRGQVPFPIAALRLAPRAAG